MTRILRRILGNSWNSRFHGLEHMNDRWVEDAAPQNPLPHNLRTAKSLKTTRRANKKGEKSWSRRRQLVVKIKKKGRDSLDSVFAYQVDTRWSCVVCLGHFLCCRICSQLEIMVLSARSHKILPRQCAKLLFLASEWIGLLSKTYLELFPLLQVPS